MAYILDHCWCVIALLIDIQAIKRKELISVVSGMDMLQGDDIRHLLFIPFAWKVVDCNQLSSNL
jgi:hypothetical protein